MGIVVEEPLRALGRAGCLVVGACMLRVRWRCVCVCARDEKETEREEQGRAWLTEAAVKDADG